MADDTLVNTFDLAYSGIPFKSWIDFFIHAPDYLEPLLQGDYAKAASRATDYFSGLAIDAGLEQVGLLGVSAPAQLAAWPIKQALVNFNQTVNAAAFRYQCNLYFQARVDGNTVQEILDTQASYTLLPHSAIMKTTEGWLATVYDYLPQFPNSFTPQQFYPYAELLWQAKAAYSNSYSSDNQTLGGQFRLAAAPGIPVISVQPQSQSINSGDTAIFTVQATGAGTLHYYWSFNGVIIFGSDAPSYYATQSGTYSVMVSNSVGQVNSQAATLTVNSGVPSIVQQPASRSVLSGSTVVFKVVASGSAPLTYRWQRNGVDIPSATGASYSVVAQSSNNGALFSVRVSNSLGSVTTSQASLSLATPTTIIWTGAQSGDWFDYRNWSPLTVPTGSDYISVNSGSVNVPSGYSLEYLNLNGGSLSGSFTVTGTLNWSGGTISSGILTMASGGVLNISGGDNKFLSGCALTNGGTVNLSGGTLYEMNGAVISNLAGGTFNLLDDSAINSNGGAQPSISNAGTFRKSGGTGTSAINGINFNNTGLVDVVSGSLSASGSFNNDGTTNIQAGTFTGSGGGTSSGVFNTAPGANTLLSGGTLNFGPNISFTGGGAVKANSNFTLNGDYGFQGLEITGGQIVGVFTIKGSLTWSGGTISSSTLTVAAGGVLNMSGASNKFLSGGALNNGGTVNLSGGTLYEMNGAVVSNLAGGTFNVLSDGAINSNGGAQPSFSNAGTFRKSAGAGSMTINLPFGNSGLVDAQSGTIAITGGGTSNGAFNAGSGAANQFASASFSDGASFTGAGVNRVAGSVSLSGSLSSQNLELASGTLNGSATITGTVNWTGGTLAPGTLTMTSGSVLNLSGASNKFLSGGIVNNAGTLNLSGGTFYEMNGAAFSNLAGSTFNVIGSASINSNGGAQPTFSSAGVINIQTGTLTFGGLNPTVSGGVLKGAGHFASTTINLTGGVAFEDFQFSEGTIIANNTAGFTGTLNWSGGTISSGILTMASGGVLNISGGDNKFLSGCALTNGGTVNLSGGTLYEMNGAVISNLAGGTFNVLSDGAINSNGGAQPSISNAGTFRKSGGTGTTNISGITFNNTGLVDVVSGVLNFGSGYTQTSSGGLNIGISGIAPGTQFGKVVVSGQAVLGGALNVIFMNGFQTSVGNSFQVLAYGSRTGNFSSITAANLNLDYTLTPNLSTSSLTLTTVLTGYAQWKIQQYGANAGNPAIAGDTADPNGSGIPNLLKYGFNTETPGVGRSWMPSTATERDATDQNLYFTLRYSRRIGSTELNYTVEVSDTLDSWDRTGTQIEQVGVPVPNADGVSEQVKVRVKTPIANLNRKFLRVGVSRN